MNNDSCSLDPGNPSFLGMTPPLTAHPSGQDSRLPFDPANNHRFYSSNNGFTPNCKKRKRMSEGGSEQQREVVHVRAKRGQATDSHSLAERLRREKINEKLRCLQDLVPGCYKTMRMAGMLDVIINYVRSLQNQIDFLSMKLSAASLFYDFNSSEAEAMEALHGNMSGYESGASAQVMERTEGEICMPKYFPSSSWFI